MSQAAENMPGDQVDDQGEPVVDLDALRAKRISALAAKWAKGSDLPDAQLRELAPHIPEVAERLREQDEKSESDPETAPEGSGKAPDWPYSRPPLDYEPIIGKDKRTLYRYLATGRERGDLPPFDEPWFLADWWGRNMAQKVPARLLELALTNPEDVEVRPIGSVGPVSIDEGDLGFLAELENIRREVAQAAASLKIEQQKSEPNLGRVKILQESLTASRSMLRDYERDAPKILEAQGLYLLKPDVERVLRDKHQVIGRNLRGLGLRVYNALKASVPGFVETVKLEAFLKTSEDELDKILEGLNETGFGGGAENA